MSRLKKNNILFWRTTDNYSMITEIESAFSVSASMRVRKMWSVNRLQYQSKFK